MLFQVNEYRQRINRVLDYIEKNLDKNLTLDELAGVSCFSRFHFNRIFSAMMGETLFQFIQRIRLEKAAARLCGEKDVPVIDIALDCGFGSSASFARRFKAGFGMTPTEWRRKSNIRQLESNISMPSRNNRKAFEYSRVYTQFSRTKNMWRYVMDKKEIKVEVKEVEPMTVVYVRHVGPYAGNAGLFEELYGKLCKWAGPRDLINPPETKFLCIYHDNPDITEEDKLRVSVCLTVPEGTEVSGEIGKTAIPGGKYAIGRFEIDPSEYGEAWQFLCGEWLPSSGYEPDDRPCFELAVNDPREHPEGKHIVDIYEPVRPLQ